MRCDTQDGERHTGPKQDTLMPRLCRSSSILRRLVLHNASYKGIFLSKSTICTQRLKESFRARVHIQHVKFFLQKISYYIINGTNICIREEAARELLHKTPRRLK